MANLAECERCIERGLRAYVRTGLALGQIRDQKLYADRYPSFKAYLKQRWSMSDGYARRLIRSARVASDVEEKGFDIPKFNQALELARLPEKDRVPALKAAGPKPTVRSIRNRPERQIQYALTCLSSLVRALEDAAQGPASKFVTRNRIALHVQALHEELEAARERCERWTRRAS